MRGAVKWVATIAGVGVEAPAASEHLKYASGTGWSNIRTYLLDRALGRFEL